MGLLGTAARYYGRVHVLRTRTGTLLGWVPVQALADPESLTREAGKAASIEHTRLYKVIIASTDMAAAIDDDIESLYTSIRDRYSRQFPELESLVQSSLDYARVVQRIGMQKVRPHAQAHARRARTNRLRGRPTMCCGRGTAAAPCEC